MNLNYLFTPACTIIDPPLDTNLQELPLEKLSWEDFEKLCLALVEIDFSINDCEIYGIKGQAQEGIDIYAKRSNGRYFSYQCKRYHEFDLSDLNKTVNYFRVKAFFLKSDKLFLCTSCEWNKTQIQDRFEVLKAEFKDANIDLVKWDKIQICRLLKTLPQIVYDFFGVEWVKKFNGDVFVRQLSHTKKLDGLQVAKFRKDIYEFYTTIFNLQDPGIPIPELNSAYTIQERFIVPDTISNVQSESFDIPRDKTIQSRWGEQIHEGFDYEEYWYERNEYISLEKLRKTKEAVEESNIQLRINIDEALSANRKSIIVGDPGAGKSTLLRFIILDILSNNPVLENISRQYGKLLPIWLPFAFLSKHLTQDDSLSIEEILKLWFKSLGKESLYEGAKDALNDERLFLIVDGIDEWNNFSSAQQAIARLETVIGLFDCHILYSSRPYGFRLLKEFFRNLKVLTLASFTLTQQKEFIKRWYTKWALLQSAYKNDHQFSESLSESFVRELALTGDLKKLAENPLLLSILIVQRMRDSVLPKNKLEALKEITQYLINKHPLKRIKDAGIVQPSQIDIDFKEIFCELAIYIQKESNDGVVTKLKAQKSIEFYLIQFAGYDKLRAKLRSQELIDIGANSFGIIIEKSNDEIAFSHKQFQEFLAAQYLYESDHDTSNEFIQTYAADPSFHQVITNFFGLIPPKQIKIYQSYFTSLIKAKHEKYQNNYLTLLSYEVSINLDNAPYEIMNRNFGAVLIAFEYETDPLYKEALLLRILDALHNTRLKDKVFDFLLQYFPVQNKYKDYRVYSLRFADELLPQQIEFLQKALINGTIEVRLDSSYALRKQITNEQVNKFIRRIIKSDSNPDIISFAINCLITNDLPQQVIDDLLLSVESNQPQIQFFLAKYKVFTKRYNEDDLDSILLNIKSMPYSLEHEFFDLLISGFGSSERLRTILLKSIDNANKPFEENTLIIDLELAWKVLFHCFSAHNDVIDLLQREIETKEFPFLSTYRSEMWQYMPHYFKENSTLIPVVEEWLLKRLEKHDFIDPEVTYASIYVHTEKIKDLLLRKLPDATHSHWIFMGLLDGWPKDEYIKKTLKDYFRNEDPKKTSFAAHYGAEVFDDEKNEGIEILEEILFNTSLTFRERAIPALLKLDKSYFEEYILAKLINVIDSFPKDVFGQYYNVVDEIVRNFHEHPLVKAYVLKQTDELYFYTLFAKYYSDQHDALIKPLLKSTPMSKELRLLIIERLSGLEIPQKYIDRLAQFDKEEYSDVKADMALCLFTQLKNKDCERIINISDEMVFGKGFDFHILRNIAFCGFVLTHRLPEYFSKEEASHQSNPMDIFREYSHRDFSSNLISKTLVDEFEYLISTVGKDFKILIARQASQKLEDIWGFFAKNSVKSSPSFSYLLDYIQENVESITNPDIISFLSRVLPQSSTLKNILLRLVKDSEPRYKALIGRLLGSNFRTDKEVYEEAKLVKDYKDQGRIIALCTGWPNEPILEEIFHQAITNRFHVDDYVGFYLKFLFRDIDNLMRFLKDTFSHPAERIRYHKKFFRPLIERLKRDKDFSSAIKQQLLSTSLIEEKISYYNLLAQVDLVDEDVKQWKNQIDDFKNDYGYDIVSNRTIRLRDVLHDYYF